VAEKILMIALSPTMEEGSIIRWNRAEGEQVESGDLLCEVETDKAAMEYESPASGTLLKILVPEGGSARVADPIAVVGKEGEDISKLLEEVEAEGGPGAGGEGAAVAGAAARRAREAPVGAPSPDSVAGLSAPEPQRAPGRMIRSSPLARSLAAQRGIDLGRVRGTGPGGRVVKRDIEGLAAEAPAATRMDTPAAPPPADQVIPVTGKRKVIAQRLSESKFEAPHYYLKLSIVMDGIMEARKRLNARRERKVSLNAFIVKLAADALKRHPEVNASWMGETIKRFGSIDIGLAVAVPDGLMTPVVRNCGAKGILQIDEELSGLVDKTLAGRLAPEEYSGATFTLTNLGSFGIEEFTAIINPPGSAILALGKIEKQLRVADGVVPQAGDESWKDHIVLKSMMRVSLSCDHRVVDGAVGAAFLNDLKGIMEDPIRSLY